MEITCPACKKANQTGDKCLRCGCDLSILRQIREAATYELGRAARQLRNNNGQVALEHAKRSWSLKNSASAARTAFMACLLMEKFDEATQWYARLLKLRHPLTDLGQLQKIRERY